MNIINTPVRLLPLESIDSTNDYLKTLALDEEPVFCLAERQTKGKGRLGRSWYSPFAENIYLSCRYFFKKDLNDLAGLSLVIGLALIKALKPFLPDVKLQAKWPNDIVYKGKKLAGVLVEFSNKNWAIIGIGLNVNMVNAEIQHVSQPWTSLAKILGHHLNREEIATAIIEGLLLYLKEFAERSLAGFMQEWQEVDYLYGKQIDIRVAAEKLQGVAKGVDERGRLLVEQIDGTLQAVSAGEVKLYNGRL